MITGALKDNPGSSPTNAITLLAAVAVWAPGSYTAGAIAGEQGERLRSLLAENANRVGEGTPD